MRKLRDLGLAVALLLPLLTLGCRTIDGDDEGEPLRDEDLKHGVHWDDLMGEDGKNRPDTGTPQAAAGVGNAAGAPVAAAPAAGRRPAASPLTAMPLAVVTRALGGAAAYEGGTLGDLGASRVFVASTGTVPDASHLYWVMVKVLSEKYGCFMSAKLNGGTRTRVTCADGRQVVFRRSRGPDWIGFRSEQFDAAGYQITVRNRRIIRVSEHTVLALSPAGDSGRRSDARPVSSL